MLANRKRPLTLNILRTETKQHDITKITEFNGNDLRLTDISIITVLPNIRVLNLDNNYIELLLPLQNCNSLRELNLHHNLICHFSEFDVLKRLQIEVLTVSDNPCTRQIEDYRNRLIRMLPHLKILDNVEITDNERMRAIMVRPKATAASLGLYKKKSTTSGITTTTDIDSAGTSEPTTGMLDTVKENEDLPTSRSVYAFTSVMGSISELNIKQLKIVMDKVAKELLDRIPVKD